MNDFSSQAKAGSIVSNWQDQNILLNQNIRLKKQKGNMLLQVAITIVVLTIFTLAGMYGMKYINSAKVANELDELSSLRTSTISLGLNTGNSFSAYNTNTTGLLAGLNFFAPERVTGTGGSTVVSNQWKGTIVATVSTSLSPNDSLTFTYTGYPTAACNEVLISAARIAQSITVGGTTVMATPAAGLQLATAQTACSNAADNATIAYTFAK